MNLKTNSDLKQLEEIKVWLIEEDKKTNQGFYCNWNIIETSFNRNLFFTFEFEEKIIGFLCWTDFDSYIGIDIMEIHPEFRNKKFGREFYKKAEKYFQSKKYKAIKLFCAPKESEHFWKKMEFRKFPNRGCSEPELTYYKPLIELNEPVIEGCDNKLELWNLEPYQIKEQKANWIWNIKNNNKPILQPCNPNWNLRLTLEGKVINEDKVKYFSRDKEIYLGHFLFIETIE